MNGATGESKSQICSRSFWAAYEAATFGAARRWAKHSHLVRRNHLAMWRRDYGLLLMALDSPQPYDARTHDQTMAMDLPLSSTSRSEARIFCSSMLGASGSKRPSFCAFFHASTLSDRVSYSVLGIVYLGTAVRSEKSVRAAGGRVSST